MEHNAIVRLKKLLKNTEEMRAKEYEEWNPSLDTLIFKGRIEAYTEAINIIEQELSYLE